MSRPLQQAFDGNSYHPLGELLEVWCRDDCAAKRKDGGCKLIDGKE
jgi:hypothetical protein